MDDQPVDDTKVSWSSVAVQAVLEQREFAVLATIVAASASSGQQLGDKILVHRNGTVTGSFGDGAFDDRVIVDAAQVLEARHSEVRDYDLGPVPTQPVVVSVFHEVIEPQPQLLVVGAGHIAVPLVRYAKTLGFEVVVLDDRDKYASRERFPDADEVIAADFGATLQDFLITPSTYVVVITRAHTYDEEALRIILGRPWAYLGMIGSRRRVQTVLRTLVGEGLDRERLAEVRAPIGLDLGAETPEEIALAIIAEVVAARRGGTGQVLSKMIRPIAA